VGVLGLGGGKCSVERSDVADVGVVDLRGGLAPRVMERPKELKNDILKGFSVATQLESRWYKNEQEERERKEYEMEEMTWM